MLASDQVAPNVTTPRHFGHDLQTTALERVVHSLGHGVVDVVGENAEGMVDS